MVKAILLALALASGLVYGSHHSKAPVAHPNGPGSTPAPPCPVQVVCNQ